MTPWPQNANQMKVLLISDVHANLPALDAVLSRASYDEVLFMGDAVDYGPFPFEVCSRLEPIRATRVLGNHDATASLGIDCRSSPLMHEASGARADTRENPHARVALSGRQSLGTRAARHAGSIPLRRTDLKRLSQDSYRPRLISWMLIIHGN